MTALAPDTAAPLVRITIELPWEELAEMAEIQVRRWGDWPARFRCNEKRDIWSTPSWGYSNPADRVPVATVSVVDFTAVLLKEASVSEINQAMRTAADGPLAGIMEYTEEELVSSELKGNPHSSIFSATDTVTLGNMVKAVAWYDNEWGYSCRIADLCRFLAERGL